jgi:hypothetical protein
MLGPVNRPRVSSSRGPFDRSPLKVAGRAADSGDMIFRSVLLMALVAVGGACASAPVDEPVVAPTTTTAPAATSTTFDVERAARRDREICLNPLRSCRTMTAHDWEIARIEWEVLHVND